MKPMKWLVATCLFALSVGAASAETINDFDISGTFDNQSIFSSNGTFTGNIELGATTGKIYSIDIFVSGFGSYTNVLQESATFVNNADTLTLLAPTGDPSNPFSPFDLFLPIFPSSLANFTTGTISDGIITTNESFAADCNNLTTCAGSVTGTISPAATPLPAALPLFAGGLGMIGLLTRRRKRNAAAFAPA